MSTPEQQAGPSWSRNDLIESPHEHVEKAARVRSMFASIAPRYDLNNTLHSFGLDRRWRRKAVSLSRIDQTSDVLDVACGTGALAENFRSAGARSVVGLDYTPGMLDVARKRNSKGPEPQVEYVQGDAMALPFEAAAFDVVSIAFGIRNVADSRSCAL